MTRSELIKRVKARYQNLYLKDVSLAVSTVLDGISNSLAQGDRIELRGFGSFSTRRRAPRMARNPKTGEKVTLDERFSVYFRAGKELRERLNRE